MLKISDIKFIKRRIIKSSIVVVLCVLLTWESSSCKESLSCIISGSYFTGAFAAMIAMFAVPVLIVSIIELIISKYSKTDSSQEDHLPDKKTSKLTDFLQLIGVALLVAIFVCIISLIAFRK